MNRFKNILYIVDDQAEDLSPSLMRAASLARNNQADLTLLHVLPKLSISFYSKQIGIDGKAVQKKIVDREQARLHRIAGLLDKGIDARTELRVGKWYVETIRAVQAGNFDLVMKEAGHVSWLDRLIGNDDMDLLRECPCPVWLMKKDEKPDYGTIVAAVDFDSESDEPCNDEINELIINLASSLCLSDFAALHVVNIYDVPEAGFITMWVEQPDKVESELFTAEQHRREHKMEMLFNEMEQKLGRESYDYLSPRSHIVRGNPGKELPKVATDIGADLVVMGTLARTGIAGVLIGNTAETVLSQLQCSVLAIKPKGFVSPVS